MNTVKLELGFWECGDVMYALERTARESERMGLEREAKKLRALKAKIEQQFDEQI